VDIDIESSIARLIDGLRNARFRILGTLSICGLLIVIFFIEMLVARHYGYATPKALFDATKWKSLIAIFLGPVIHQTTDHLVNNLASLVIVGAYIEYSYGERRLYEFSAIAGYASIWVVVIVGLTGAVGFSGVTYGLWSWATVHAFVRLTELVEDVSEFWLIGHVIPLLIGIGQIKSEILTISTAQMNGGEISHVVGIALGIITGLYLLPVGSGQKMKGDKVGRISSITELRGILDGETDEEGKTAFERLRAEREKDRTEKESRH
jgi:membrane associated rhomboid family serine protease